MFAFRRNASGIYTFFSLFLGKPLHIECKYQKSVIVKFFTFKYNSFNKLFLVCVWCRCLVYHTFVRTEPLWMMMDVFYQFKKEQQQLPCPSMNCVLPLLDVPRSRQCRQINNWWIKFTWIAEVQVNISEVLFMARIVQNR